MKYAYIMVIIISLLSSTSWSKTSNPMIRNCNNIAGGEFVVMDTGYDQWGLCKFENSYVGALDVMFFNDQTAEPISFFEYAEQHTDCHGKVITATVLGTTEKFQLCQYSDSSMIDMATLSKGIFHSDNSALNKYLGL